MTYDADVAADQAHATANLLDRALAKVSVAQASAAGGLGSAGSIWLGLQDGLQTATIAVGLVTAILTCALVALKLVQKWREVRSGTPPRGEG